MRSSAIRPCPLLLVLAVALMPAAARAQPRGPQAALARVLNVPGLDDPKVTLKEVVEWLAHRSPGLVLEVDEESFKRQSINDARSLGFNPPIREQKKVSTAVALQTILHRLPAEATYVVRRDKVAVVAVDDDVLRQIAAEALRSPLLGRLRGRITIDRSLGDARLKDAVKFLKDRHGLTVLVAPRHDDLPVKLPAQTSTVEGVLKQLATQVKGACLLRHDHFLLVPLEQGAM
jgi:hypothetical protein